MSNLKFYKKLEDGILNSLHNANSKQLEILYNGGYKFIYYDKLNVKKNIESEVSRRLRNHNIAKIID